MEKEIIEGNKLIAEFRGYLFYDDNKSEYPFGYWKNNDGDIVPDDEFVFEFNYHEDLNKLIPVIDKIGEEYYISITWTNFGHGQSYKITSIDRYDIYDKSIVSLGGYDSFQNTWKCVVRFIEWYNIKNRKRKNN